MTTPTTTAAEAVDHAMTCLSDATTGLTITDEHRPAGAPEITARVASLWFSLGPITNCHINAFILASGGISVTLTVGNIPFVQITLTLDPGRDTALIRDAVNLYVNHYGIGGNR